MISQTPDLTCREIIELVSDYIEGALPPGDRERFLAHLEGCDGCDGFVEQIRATIRITGRIEPAQLAPDARARLIDAFRGWKGGPREEPPSLVPRRLRDFFRRR